MNTELVQTPCIYAKCMTTAAVTTLHTHTAEPITFTFSLVSSTAVVVPLEATTTFNTLLTSEIYVTAGTAPGIHVNTLCDACCQCLHSVLGDDSCEVVHVDVCTKECSWQFLRLQLQLADTGWQIWRHILWSDTNLWVLCNAFRHNRIKLLHFCLAVYHFYYMHKKSTAK